MEHDILQRKIAEIIKSHSKFSGKDLFKDDVQPSFYFRMIKEFDFYILMKDEAESSIFEEIKAYLAVKTVPFATFSFFEDKNNKYLTICHEFKIYTIIIDENHEQPHLNAILSFLTRSTIHFITPNRRGYEQFNELIKKISSSNKQNSGSDKSYRINLNNIIFPEEEEQANIESEINTIRIQIENKIRRISLLNITKDSFITFVIRRFYFPKNDFEDPSFFEYKSFIYNNHIHLREFKNNDIIRIRDISRGIFLILDKITNQLFIQKIRNIYITDDEFATEKEMYEAINSLSHFVKCFGYTKNKEEQIESIIIEFMSGTTLQNYILNNKQIKYEEKYKLSLDIIEGLQILHSNNFIHRDLKPDNIFINHDHQIFIGDFNCSKFVDSKTQQVMTSDIGSIIYSSPEILNFKEYDKSTDIYSFGLILYFIYKEENPLNNHSESEIIDIKNQNIFIYLKDQIFDDFVHIIIRKCVHNDPQKRSNAENIIKYYFIYSLNQLYVDEFKFISYFLLNNNSNVFNILKPIIFKNIDKEQMKNINKSHILFGIYQYILIEFNNSKLQNKMVDIIETSANKNDHYSQYVIGMLYLFERNIEKAIFYLTLSANYNNSEAQYYLGQIYLSDSFDTADINGRIHHITLSANNNNPNAQLYLGLKYLKEIDGIKNTNKGIYYITLSANNNNSIAQNKLGNFYFYNGNTKGDIEKGIYYFTLSADNNNAEAQYSLGKIYFDGEKNQKDINKGVNYLTLSANNNNSKAQFLLGINYIRGGSIPININKGMMYLTLSANDNNDDAHFILGLFYFSGLYVQQNIIKGINHFLFAANNNNSYAQYYLGLIYFRGENIPKDINKGIHYLTLSANNNNSAAQHFIGRYYFYSNNINKGLHYLTLSVNNNNSNAQYTLGYIYLNNQNITKNINKGIYYLTLSANNNNSDAQFALGLEYFSCHNIPQDMSKVIYYLTLSANNNNSLAQCLLGLIYFYGKKVQQDTKKGIHYITLSANKNNVIAQCSLGYIYFFGQNIKQDIKKGIKYFTLSAGKNDPDANYWLGIIYFNGVEVQQDINKGLYHLKLSANQNHVLSSKVLGLIYLNNINVTNDIPKAINYFKISADQGNVESNLYLGIIYYSKIYMKQDIQQAIHYYKEASSFNNQYAKNNLAIIYKNGVGVQKNTTIMLEYLNEGIRQKNDDFCLYNLARICYFGIEQKTNIERAINLLTESTKNNFSPSIFFLYLIYSFGEKEIKNTSKSINLEQHILYSDFPDILKFVISHIDIISKEILFNFIKDYDLVYSYVSDDMKGYSEIKDYYQNLLKEIFPNESCFKENKNKRTQPKDINELFYEGFNVFWLKKH